LRRAEKGPIWSTRRAPSRPRRVGQRVRTRSAARQSLKSNLSGFAARIRSQAERVRQTPFLAAARPPVSGSPAPRLAPRLRLAQIVLAVGLLAIAGRLFHVQVLGHRTFAARASAQQERRVTLPARRGDVVDRNGRGLLHTLAGRTLVARPAEIENAARAAKQLAPVIRRPAAEIKRLLSQRRPLVELDSELDDKEWSKVRALKLKGIRIEEAGRRVKLVEGADLLGAVNKDGRGDEGIECAMESYLSGTDGWETRYTDARGRETGLPGGHAKRPAHGDRVVLTLDADLEWIVEDALRAAIAEHNARAGSAVLVEVETGEILALAAVGAKGPGEGRRVNRIAPIEDTYEPGSTFKIVTFAAALDRKLIDDGAVFFAENGRARFGSCEIRDVKKMGWLCTPDVIAQSSNIATAKIGELVGAEALYEGARRLGFGRRTHIELPGEVAGILRPVSEWSGRSIPTVAIGQEVAVTSLQLAMAYAAIAGGGELKRPRLVREILRADGSVRIKTETEVVRRAMSEETAATLNRYLQRVVETGTGKRARLPGVAVAGKTGTAQKARTDGRGYAMGRYVSSFVGFFPADAPRYVLSVSIDEPAGMHYGGEVAAPVFSRIAGAMLGPAHEFDGLRTVAATPAPVRREVLVPDVRLMSAGAAMAELAAAGLDASVRAGKNERILTQDPLPGTRVARGKRVALGRAEDAGEVIPDLRGLSLREALRHLRGVGVEARVEGVGLVAAQSPAPGTQVSRTLVCRLRLVARSRDLPRVREAEPAGEVPSVLAAADLPAPR
jgi:cell division protein FtsI/penicillin-binding protein 2